MYYRTVTGCRPRLRRLRAGYGQKAACILFIISIQLVRVIGAFGQSNGAVSTTPADAPPAALNRGDTLPARYRPLLLPPGRQELPSITLLYFWHTTCLGCWQKMPGFDSLQRSFNGQLALVPITREPAEKVRQLAQKRPQLQGLQLHQLYADTLLHGLFPFLFVPHVVWLDSAGQVLAVTAAGQVNAAAVQQALQGQTHQWRQKQDLSFFNREQPLLSWNTKAGYNLHPPLEELIAWAGYAHGTEPGMVVQQGAGGGRITAVNATPQQLFERVYRLPPFTHHWHIAPAADSLFFKPPHLSQEEWLERVARCFELQWTGPATPQQVATRVHRAIAGHLGLSGTIDSLDTECWEVLGSGKPGGTRRLHDCLYRYNQQYPHHLVTRLPATATCHTAPGFSSWQGFEQWCRHNGYTAARTLRRLPHFFVSIISSP